MGRIQQSTEDAFSRWNTIRPRTQAAPSLERNIYSTCNHLDYVHYTVDANVIHKNCDCLNYIFAADFLLGAVEV